MLREMCPLVVGHFLLQAILDSGCALSRCKQLAGVFFCCSPVPNLIYQNLNRIHILIATKLILVTRVIIVHDGKRMFATDVMPGLKQ